MGQKATPQPRVISLFCGGGGSACGWRMAGFDVIAGVEIRRSQADIFQANFPEAIVYETDIHKLSAKKVMRDLGLERGDLEVLDGSPPCQDFSTAHPQTTKERKLFDKRNFAGSWQRTDDLFWHFVRFLRAMSPRFFVAENVEGMVKGKMAGYFNEVLDWTRKSGYQVLVRRMNAANYSVPQSRPRIIFVGERSESKSFEWPEHHDRVVTWGDVVKRISNNETVNQIKRDSKTYRYWQVTKQGRAFGPTSIRNDGKIQSITKSKLSLRKPCPTILTGQDRFHHAVPRGLTTEELREVCSFPRGYKIPGTTSDKLDMFGECVPPLMMKAIALQVKKALR